MSILSGRTMTGLLIASVVVNLLLVGLILGRSLVAPPPLRSFPPTMGWVLRGLQPEEREAIRPLLAENMKSTMAAQRKLAEAQRRVANLMRAEQLDASALGDAFADLRTASMASQEAMHKALIKVMEALTPEQRREMMGFMRGGWRGEMGRRPGEHRNGPRERGEMPPPPPAIEGDDDGPRS